MIALAHLDLGFNGMGPAGTARIAGVLGKCEALTHLDISGAEIEVHQLLALSQHSCKPLCPVCSEIIIVAEIKVRQRWALLQHSCKPLCIVSFHFTERQRECADAARQHKKGGACS